jgi:heat shock protein HslJ
VASAPPQDPSLEGTTWRLETIAGADPALPASATAPVTLRFDAGRVEGFAGCSRISGPYAIDRDRLTVGALSRTTSACAEPAMRVEQAVAQALAGTLRHTVTGRRLTLLAESGAASTWQSEAAPMLAATNWEVTAFDNGKGAVVAPIARTTLSMTFRGGTVSGRAGCNTYSAGYSIDGDRIAIGRVASTRKACVGAGIMEQERRFLAALAAATNWSVRNGTLEMRRADGERALTAKVRDGTQ